MEAGRQSQNCFYANNNYPKHSSATSSDFSPRPTPFKMVLITDVFQCCSNQGGRPGSDWGMSVQPGGASVNQPVCLPSSKASLLRTGPFQVFPPRLSKALDPFSFGGPMVGPQPDSPLTPAVLCLVASSGQQSCRAHWKCQGMNTPSPLPSRQDGLYKCPSSLAASLPRGRSLALRGPPARRPPWPLACSHALYWLPSLSGPTSLLPACVCWSTSQVDYLHSNPCPGRHLLLGAQPHKTPIMARLLKYAHSPCPLCWLYAQLQVELLGA